MALSTIQLNTGLGSSLAARKQAESGGNLLDVLDRGLSVAANLTKVAGGIQEMVQAPEKLELARQTAADDSFYKTESLAQGERIATARNAADVAAEKLKADALKKYQDASLGVESKKVDEMTNKNLKELDQKRFNNTQDIRKERDQNKIIQNANESSVNLDRVKELRAQAAQVNADGSLSPEEKTLARDAIDNALVVAFKQVGEPGGMVMAGEAAAFKSSAWANKALGMVLGKYNPNESFTDIQLDSLQNAAEVQMKAHIAGATKIDNALELQARRSGIKLDELALYSYGGEGQLGKEPSQSVYINQSQAQQKKPGPQMDQYRSDLKNFNASVGDRKSFPRFQPSGSKGPGILGSR